MTTSGTFKTPQGESGSFLFDDESVDLRHNWRTSFPEIIGRSPILLQVLETVSKIARSESAVLVSGESGTGKELIAAALHRLSSRASKRFVAINCSAIPENLLESELFGHEKGAFTGAHNRRPGLFEVADGGTLFLDEIGDMPLRLQAKLLRVLQEKQFTSVGGHQIKSANVRVVAATNIDLSNAVKDGRFRLDLFYRLNVLPVVLPSLRERREDIPDLLDHFLDCANRLHASPNPCFFNRAAIHALCKYSWPGNVRELQNLIERLVVICNGGEIGVENLPQEVRDDAHGMRRSSALATSGAEGMVYPETHGALPSEGLDLPSYIEELENSLIVQALERTSNNKNQAARLLGLNRTTLVERIKKRKIGALNNPTRR